jgi:hypothetical protein
MENSAMAKKKAGRPKGQSIRGEGKLVRIDPNVVGMARVVTGRRGTELGPYLSELLAGPVRRDYVAVLRELSALEGGTK